MTLPICPHPFKESGIICGPFCAFPSEGGRQGIEHQGGVSREVYVDLSTIAYVAGGVEFAPLVVSLSSVRMMDVLGSTDPFCEKITPCGVGISLDCTDPCAPKLIIHNEAGEVPDGWTLDCKVWLRFYGTP